MVGRAEWLEERRKGFGGSDVAAALDESEFGCRRRLAYDKQGVPEDYPQDNEGVLRRGRELEPIVAKLFEEKTGWKVVRRSSSAHPLYPWARVSVDREILAARDVKLPDGTVLKEPGVGVMEMKTRGGWQFRRVERDGAFVSDLLQLQWGMFVRQRAWGALAVFNPESWALEWFPMAYDSRLIEGVVPPIRELWEKIQAGVLPEKLDPTDRRCARCAWRRTCQGEALAASLPEDDRKEPIVRDDSFLELVADRQELKALIAEHETVLEAIEGRLKAKLGDMQAVEVEGFRVYYRQQRDSEMVDKALLEKKFPEIYQQVKKFRRGARPLKVYAV
jgi:predicted phage-related endonuclease